MPPQRAGRPGEAAPGVSVQIAHAFGSHCGTGLRDSAWFADAAAQYLVHPVGRHISFRHIASGESTYVIESPQVQAITACAMSRNRAMLAVCERCSSGPATQISVYNLRVAVGQPERQPARTLQELGAVGLVTCAGFSADEEASLLVLASAAPESLLVVVDWRNNHVVGRCKLPCLMDRVALSPLEDGVVSATGSDSLRLWAIKEEKREAVEGSKGEAEGAASGAPGVDELPDDVLEALPRPAGLSEVPSTYTDHAWIEPADGMLLACTEECQAHLMWAPRREPPRLLRTIVAPFQAFGEAPRCVRCFIGGFVFGGGAATLALWERPQAGGAVGAIAVDPEATAAAFQHVRTARVAPGPVANDAICCIDVAGGGEDRESREERLVLGFSGRSIGTLDLPELRRPHSGGLACELLCGGFHPGPVTGLAMAVLRPILASVCRQECAVRIWNYATRRCELRWEFPGEEPVAVAIHPLGYFLAVGFTDRVRLMQVLVEELKPHREIPLRGVRLLRFSNGGHLLAAAQSKLVLVFSARTLAKVATLRGHSQQVVSMCFHPDDRSLTTCGEDGSLVEWSTQTWGKAHDFAADRSLGAEASSVAGGGHGHACVALVEGPRAFLRSFRQCSHTASDDLELPSNVRLGSLCHHDGQLGITVLGAASSGALWWASGLASLLECKEFGLHTGACLDLCLSADARTIATAGEDGAIFVLRVAGLASQEGARGPVDNEVVMINRGEIQLRDEEIQQLAAEAASLKVQLVEDSARMQSECVARVAEARKKDQEEIRVLRLRCETLQQASTAQERESLRQMKAMEATHVQAADRLETIYDKKIRHEADRFSAVEGELRQLAERLESLREESEQKLESQRARQRLELERRVGEKAGEVQRLKDLIAFSQHRFDTMLDQEAMEQDFEAAEQVRKSQNELEQQRLVEYKLKKEQDTMLRGLDMIEKDREHAAKEQFDASVIVNNLTAEVERLQREVTTLKLERREREATLRDKELEIGAYKVKANTLKKFKHVLDFRLREVTQSLQPKDETIAQLGNQLRDLEEEFEQQLEVQKQMGVSVQSLDEQIREKAAECSRLREVIKQRDQTTFRFTEDLRDLATNEQDLRRWPEGIRRIHRAHVRPERLSKDAGGLAMQELERQVRVTERKASILAAKGRSSEEERKANLRQRADENTELINELDKLRRERKELSSQMKHLELKVKQAEQRQARLQGAVPALGDRGQSPDVAEGGGRSGGEAAAKAAEPMQGFFGPKALSQVPALSSDPFAGKLRKPGLAHRGPEERRQMQRLLAAADLRSQQVQMQRLEQKLLQDQLDRLLQERPTSAVKVVGADKMAAPAAGAGRSAARLVASMPA